MEEKVISMKEIFEGLDKATDNELGFSLETFSNFIMLPDDQFEALKPAMLAEFGKNINNVNDGLMLAQVFNSMGIKAEDLASGAPQLMENIKAIVGEKFNESKADFISQVLMILFNMITVNENVAKRVIQIPIELMSDEVIMPNYANPTDAGLDVYALEDITINPGETKLIKTGIKVALPYGYELQVRPKSGRALKTKMRIANSPGTIDSGYRDEIGVIIDNIEPPIKDITYETELVDGKPEIKITSILHGNPMFIGKGEKFAQLVLKEQPKVIFTQINSVSGIGEDRGGGFGSTGLK